MCSCLDLEPTVGVAQPAVAKRARMTTMSFGVKPPITQVLHDEDETMSEVPLSTPISIASGLRTTRGPNRSMGTPQNPRQRPSLVISESGR